MSHRWGTPPATEDRYAFTLAGVAYLPYAYIFIFYDGDVNWDIHRGRYRVNVKGGAEKKLDIPFSGDESFVGYILSR